MAQVTLSALKDALREADFPAAKDDLVVSAEQANASPEALRALRSLPLADYANVDEVIRSVNVDIGGAGRNPAEPRLTEER